jgi:hypothetical protein
MDEPSILDYLKSRLSGRTQIEIPAPRPLSPPESPGRRFPWRTLLGLVLAILAQRQFEPKASPQLAVVIYALALLAFLWAYATREWDLPPLPEDNPRIDPQTYLRDPFLISLPLAVAAFIAFTGNLFNLLNLSLWIAAIGLFFYALWLPDETLARLKNWFSSLDWRWVALVLVVFALTFFYRTYDLAGTPKEPFSDHAEKLLDVYDVLNGQFSIFFVRNTGREAFQMYLTAFIVSVFGTGLTYMSLKIGTVAAGIFTLPYIYLLGKEIANRRVALLSLLLAGIAYWPNVISRVGLRFPLYPLFAAPVLFYTLRGLRTQRRNDFLLAGLFLGLGLHGYSSFRVVPFVIITAFIVYILHTRSVQYKWQAGFMLTVVILTSTLIALPLIRYAIETPDMFLYRTMTRLANWEQPLPGPAWLIFIQNLGASMLMMNVKNGNSWVNSIPQRPALDVISAALFAVGYIFITIRYFIHRRWQDLFLLISIPLLMLSSILSLAFPEENPSVNRSGGALVIVFIICALALDGIYLTFKRQAASRVGQLATVSLLGILLVTSAWQNFDLVFNQYSTRYAETVWNTSDIGNVVRQFVEEGNSVDNVWVVPYPYWVDTRLVGIWAGYPTRDFARWPEDLRATLNQPGAKRFIIKQDDIETLKLLHNLYPVHYTDFFSAPNPGQSFWIYNVPVSQP